MDPFKLITSGLALLFVLCLIGLVSVLLRKYAGGLNFNKVKKDGRLKLNEVLNIDAKKKVVLLSKDDKEYLVAFSENEIEVIDKNNDKKNS